MHTQARNTSLFVISKKGTHPSFSITSASENSPVLRTAPCRFKVALLGLGGIFGFCFSVVNATTVAIGLEEASSVDTDPSLDPVDVKVFGPM